MWIVGLLAAILTGAYMTRQVLLVFYGNERWEATDAVAAEDAEPEHTDDDGAHVVTIDPASPTVSYGDPPHTPVLHHAPHEGNGLMVTPVVLLAGLAVVGGVLDLPFQRIEWLDEWLEPVFADAHHEIASPSFLGGVGLSVLAIIMGLIGLGVAYALYRAAWSRSTGIRSTSGSGSSAGSSAMPTTTTTASRDSSAARCAASPTGWPGCSTPASSTVP